MKQRQQVAVIGSGISGLTAAYILQHKYDVTLYEASHRLGGHTDTHRLTDSEGREQLVDSGFLVCNTKTYPLLLRLFRELEVTIAPTEMSMSVHCQQCGTQFAGSKGLRGVLATPSALFQPVFLKMLWTIPKFERAAKKLLLTNSDSAMTLQDFIAQGNYNEYFQTHYVLPLIASVWSCDFTTAREYPAVYLFQFWDNHGLLETKTLLRNTNWRVVVGGSHAYIQKITPRLHKVVLNSPINGLEEMKSGIQLTTTSGQKKLYDKVVVATHPDQALRLLTKPTKLQKQLLGAFRYTKTPTVLHTDASVLPTRSNAKAAYNYLLQAHDIAEPGVRVHYDMNRIQHLTSADSFVVSLDAKADIDPSKIIETMPYQHPRFTTASVAAQSRLAELNTDRIAFAGAYHGWGFHEDGCRAGVAAAAALGVDW